MADYAHRRTVMVDTQVRPSDVTKFPIIQAMLTVPREDFVPATQREAAYVGENVSLGGGRVVLEPRTIAKMLDALNPKPGEVALDIGSGLGYSSALMAQLAETVVAVESEPAWAGEAEAGLANIGADNAVVVEGALADGAPQHGPYDMILIQGGVEHVPEAILAQLKDGGRIAALFMERALGVCRLGYKSDGALTWRFLFNAAAPLLPGFTKRSDFAL